MTINGAGSRDKRIAFERATVAEDDHGGEVPTWSVLCHARASVRYGTSAERREAAAQQGSQVATFRVLATPAINGVTPKDRIQFDGVAWDISGVPAKVSRFETEFTAIRAG